MPRDTQERDPAALLDIYNAAQRIHEFTLGMTADQFSSDARTQGAVILQIIVMGEATKRLSLAYRDAHPQVPWSLVAGMRDRLVHDYDDWDLDKVWEVAVVDVPRLIDDLFVLLPPHRSAP